MFDAHASPRRYRLTFNNSLDIVHNWRLSRTGLNSPLTCPGRHGIYIITRLLQGNY